MPVKETVQAVLGLLHSQGHIRGVSNKELAALISERSPTNYAQSRISNWFGGKPTKNLPVHAINALGLGQFGFREDLWDLPPEEARLAVETAIGGGIVSMLNGVKPMPPKYKVLEYVTEPRQPEHLGFLQASESDDMREATIPPPTDRLEVRGKACVRARMLSEVCRGLYVRVLIEDIGRGAPVYHQANRHLGLEDGILPATEQVPDPMVLAHDSTLCDQQISRIWTIVSRNEFADPWLPADAPSRPFSNQQLEAGDVGAFNIPLQRVHKMVEQIRMSPPGLYSVFMTLVRYEPAEPV